MTEGVRVVVDRAAVANGDDGFDHRKTWLFPHSATITDLLIALATQFFPKMGMWLVYVEADARPNPHLLGIINYDGVGPATRKHHCSRQ